MSNAVLENILQIKDVLPKKQKALCNYLALNYEQIGVMTVAELAAEVGMTEGWLRRLSPEEIMELDAELQAGGWEP